MSQKIHTFAVSEHDKENMELVDKIKSDCKRNGISFTFVCLQALKQYTDEQSKKVTNGK